MDNLGERVKLNSCFIVSTDSGQRNESAWHVGWPITYLKIDHDGCSESVQGLNNNNNSKNKNNFE